MILKFTLDGGDRRLAVPLHAITGLAERPNHHGGTTLYTTGGFFSVTESLDEIVTAIRTLTHPNG